MKTKIIKMPKAVKKCVAYEDRLKIRHMYQQEWIDAFASGTLQTSVKLGMAVRDFYLVERVAFEFGWEFEVLPASRVTTGVPVSEGDESAITEFGWYAKRANWNLFYGDKMAFKYVIVEYVDGTKKEGLAFVITETSASWLPKNHLLFALVAEFNTKTGEWNKAVNPY